MLMQARPRVCMDALGKLLAEGSKCSVHVRMHYIIVMPLYSFISAVLVISKLVAFSAACMRGNFNILAWDLAPPPAQCLQQCLLTLLVFNACAVQTMTGTS